MRGSLHSLAPRPRVSHRPFRRALALAMALALIGAAAVLMPDVVLRGGLSYRPQLLASAYEYLQLAPWIGQGLGAEYLLPVAGLPARVICQ